MRIVIVALLCLNFGCAYKAKPPVEVCAATQARALIAFFPETKIRFTSLSRDVQYQFVFQDEVLWNECKRSGEIPLFRISYRPQDNNLLGLDIHGYFEPQNDGSPTSEVIVKVFDLHTNCEPKSIVKTHTFNSDDLDPKHVGCGPPPLRTLNLDLLE